MNKRVKERLIQNVKKSDSVIIIQAKVIVHENRSGLLWQASVDNSGGCY